VFNILGQRVATLLSRQVNPGTHRVRWDAAAFPSGVYLARLKMLGTATARSSRSVQITKLVLMK
jgi:hypothetical protein